MRRVPDGHRAAAAAIRVALLVTLAFVLPQCSGVDVRPCNQVAELSEGACRVGLSPGWEYSEQWRQYYEP
jgi:hypothetical protein